MIEDDSTWFAEPPLAGFQQRFEKIDRLYTHTSEFQTIEIFDTVPFGRMLALNGAAQTTERDEYIYHEMLVLVPMMTHPHPRRVAIIGGGDGGSLRRVLAFDTVERVVQIELDSAVTDACRQYMPFIGGSAFDDPRASVRFADGVRFLAETRETFDVILVDSTDPVGPAEALFSPQFYDDARRALTEDGIIVTQSGSPLLMADELVRARDNLRQVFGSARAYLASIPAYPGVLWSFLMASQGRDARRISTEEIARRLAANRIGTAYYTPDLHRASFALPRFLAARLEDGKSLGPFDH